MLRGGAAGNGSWVKQESSLWSRLNPTRLAFVVLAPGYSHGAFCVP